MVSRSISWSVSSSVCDVRQDICSFIHSVIYSVKCTKTLYSITITWVKLFWLKSGVNSDARRDFLFKLQMKETGSISTGVIMAVM